MDRTVSDLSHPSIDALLQRVRSNIKGSPKAETVPRKSFDVRDYAEFSLLESLRSTYAGSALENPYFLARSDTVSSKLRISGNDFVTFSNYNYLDLSHDPRVKKASCDAVERYGSHAGAARMVGGEIELHAELEAELADFAGFEAATVSVGGYSTNVAVIGYLFDQRDLILHDEYMHNSGVMGAVMSGARRIAFPHNDMVALRNLLVQHRDQHRKVLILVEGAYSMDGDLVDLPTVVALKKEFEAWLMVDEAHSCGTVGATGRGVCEHFGMPTTDIDLMMGTLSKSFASCGGFLAGSAEIVDLLRHFCPGLLLYSTGISPANTGAALEAVRIAGKEPERVRRLQKNARQFKEFAEDRGLDCRSAVAGVPIVPLMIEDRTALELMSMLLEHGYIAHAVMHPVVPREAARLRCFISAGHDDTMMGGMLDLIAGNMAAR